MPCFQDGEWRLAHPDWVSRTRLLEERLATGFGDVDGYQIQVVVGTNTPHYFIASIGEFWGVHAHSEDLDDAIRQIPQVLRGAIQSLKQRGKAIPPPGSERPPVRLADHSKIDAQQPLIADFWHRILGTSYRMSFVSDESQLSTWDYYAGGRDALIERVKAVYGVDITAIYDQPIHFVLQWIGQSLHNETEAKD